MRHVYPVTDNTDKLVKKCIFYPLNSELPDLFQSARNLDYRDNSLALAAVRHNTNQYERSFIPAGNRLWIELPNHIVESQELQRFKTGVNDFFRRRHR